MAELLPSPEQKASWPRRIGWFSVGYLLLLAICIPFFLLIQPKSRLGWVLLLAFGPPIYLALEWAGGKLAEPWGESTRLRKAAKAGCIVFGYLALIVVWLLFGPVVCPGGG